jgi:cyclic pyranopterin phosphate synthase
MPRFTHIDKDGQVRMVDVTEKKATARTAIAQGLVHLRPETFERVLQQKVKKGNVLETARIAGIMGAKKTAALIPMCHPLNLTHVQVDFFPLPEQHAIRIQAKVKIIDQTGVEMEALTAVSITALTIYDMCKSYDKRITISDICLLEKSGGKSGRFSRKDPPDNLK